MFSRTCLSCIRRFKSEYVTVKRPVTKVINVKDNLSTSTQADTNISDKPANSSVKTVSDLLRQKIIATGPITIAQFMREVLVNPICGYYMQKDVIGKTGDFVTSPEICQLFGELIAVWLIYHYKMVGLPKPFNLIELGPGRGTMMHDILKTFRQLDRTEQMTVHLVEISDALGEIQAKKLCHSYKSHPEEDTPYYKSGKTKDGIDIYWYKSIFDFKFKNFSLLVAHEFFDALPIHKFKKTDKGWCEVLIDVDDVSGAAPEPKFKYVLSSGPTVIAKALIPAEEKREEFELSPDSMHIMNYLGERMWQFGGIALIIDYGHNGCKSDTFRAFKDHKQVDPLTNVGSADLTADVDFSAFTRAVENKLIPFGPVTQKIFLHEMKLETRKEMLLNKYEDYKEKKKLVDACRVLTDEDKMGNCFQFISYFPAVLKNLLHETPVYGFPKEKKKSR